MQRVAFGATGRWSILLARREVIERGLPAWIGGAPCSASSAGLRSARWRGIMRWRGYTFLKDSENSPYNPRYSVPALVRQERLHWPLPHDAFHEINQLGLR